MIMRSIDLSGKRFGRLLVLQPWGLDKFGKMHWLCRCDCGSACTPSGNVLQRGDTKSCGCLHRESAHTRFFKHGEKRTQLYYVWSTAKGRCSNPKDPNYARYGGRGIRMCKAWRDSFLQFKKDMGPRPPGLSLDRIDNDGPYSKKNCRWITHLEQMRNQRKTKRFSHEGYNLTLGEWAERVGIAESCLYYRVNEAKWPITRALTTPPKVGGNKPQRPTSSIR